MTIQELNIGVRLGLQQINANLYNRFPNEQIDFYLNLTTKEFILSVLGDENNDVRNYITKEEAVKYQTALQKYIAVLDLELDKSNIPEYVKGNLPVDIQPAVIDSGLLYNGISYKVVVAGTTDLTGYGSTNPPVANTTFKCVIPNLTGASISIVSGNKYRILNADGANFVAVGASDNNPYTVFTANSSASVSGTSSTEVEVIASAPSWVDTQLYPVVNPKFFYHMSSTSYVNKGFVIGNGTLTKGTRYIVITKGTANLSALGGYASTDEGVIFSSTGGVFSGNGTILQEIEEVRNRLPKANELDNIRFNGIGTLRSTPLSQYVGDSLLTYQDSKFEVHKIKLRYITTPIPVDYNNNITSDMPESLHGILINLTVSKMAATLGSNTYQFLENENRKIEDKTR